MTDELTIEQAVGMLPEGEYVHTFRNPNGILIGGDWKRDELVETFNKFGVGLSGPQATAMKHGLVVKDDRGFLFVETKEKAEGKQ